MEPIILTPDQHTVIGLLSKHPELSKQFYLSGGTALAVYYLHHRISDDLDFFTDGDVPLATVTEFMQETKAAVHATKLDYEHLFDRHIFTIHATPALKVEFTKYPFPRMAPLQKKDGIFVDSLLDIAINKLFALFDRNEPKDFVDLYFLLQTFALPTLIKGVHKKFDFAIAPLTLGAELLKVRHLTMMPRMRAALTREEITAFFEQEASRLGKDILT
jgi:hypothetical protein